MIWESLLHLWRLIHAQSAFCIRDVISMAAGNAQPAELGRIYEWYSARTTRAIATSYVIGAGALAGLLQDVLHHKAGDPRAWPLFAVVLALAALAALFQHAELAQLPREFAEATRLLARFSAPKGGPVDLGIPLPAKDRMDWWGVGWVVALLLLAGLVGCRVGKEHDGLELAAVVLATVAMIVLLKRVGAELRPALRPPETGKHDLVDSIGDVRLDVYATNRKIAEQVNTCIEDAPRAVEATDAAATVKPAGSQAPPPAPRSPSD